MNIKRTPVALAVGALLAAPLVMAQENGVLTEEYSVVVHNTGTVSITNAIDSGTTVRTSVGTTVNPTSIGAATVDDKQLGSGNAVLNYAHDNNAGIGGTAGDNANGNGATGNIGVNVAAGDNNMQDNAAAIAADDAAFTFGTAQSQAMTTQLSTNNVVLSEGSSNTAAVNGGFAGAGGNIGINVTAGNGNMQKNNLSISSAHSAVSMASVQNVQRSKDNLSINTPVTDTVMTSASITLDVGPNNGAGGVTGTYRGQSDQVGNVYPDIWSGNVHNVGTQSQVGHFDLDSEAQGAQPGPNGTGALLFDEAGDLALQGTITGTAVVLNAVIVKDSVNNASLGGGALSGAHGNIGVNIASGNGNLQNNSLSVAVSLPIPNGNSSEGGS